MHIKYYNLTKDVSCLGYTFCQRLDEGEYHCSAKKTTKRELVSLLKTIDEDSSLSSKERKKLLDQFYASNPAIFLQYFDERGIDEAV